MTDKKRKICYWLVRISRGCNMLDNNNAIEPSLKKKEAVFSLEKGFLWINCFHRDMKGENFLCNFNTELS